LARQSCPPRPMFTRRHGAGLLEHRAHDVLTLSAGGERQPCPRCRLAVAIPKPFERADRRFLAVNLDWCAIERRAVFRFELRGAEFRAAARPCRLISRCKRGGRGRGMARLQDDFLLGRLRIVVRRGRRSRDRHILQHHGYRAAGMHLDPLGASLFCGADGAGNIGLRDCSRTSWHGALSMANSAFYTPTNGLSRPQIN
jgi:hypothetical protein